MVHGEGHNWQELGLLFSVKGPGFECWTGLCRKLPVSESVGHNRGVPRCILETWKVVKDAVLYIAETACVEYIIERHMKKYPDLHQVYHCNTALFGIFGFPHQTSPKGAFLQCYLPSERDKLKQSSLTLFYGHPSASNPGLARTYGFVFFHVIATSDGI
jgi:hypothetical protein